MSLVLGFFFIALGLLFVVMIYNHIKNVKNRLTECYHSTGIIEKIELIPDKYDRTLGFYKILVKYNDSLGQEHFNQFTVALKEIEIGDRCNVLVNKFNPKVSYIEGGETLFLSYTALIVFSLFIIVGVLILTQLLQLDFNPLPPFGVVFDPR